MPRTEVVRELQRIQAENGVLRPLDVVKEAMHPASPLHPHFNWDDTEAAHQWRLQQARQLIRVIVTHLPYEEPRFEVRAFVSLSPDRHLQGGGYRVMTEVLAAPSERAQLLADALEELSRLKVKYHNLTELDGVFRAVDRARMNYAPPPQQDSGGGDAASP